MKCVWKFYAVYLLQCYCSNYFNNIYNSVLCEELIWIYISFFICIMIYYNIGFRIISSLPEDVHMHVCNQLAISLCRRFKEDNLDIMTINVYTSALNGCFDNFPLGTLAVTKSQDEAVMFILNSLHVCIFHLK